MIDKRIQYRVGGASGREYDQGGNRNTKSTKSTTSNPNMGGGGGRDSGAGPIGPVAPPTTFIGGKQFNVTPFNRDERERARIKSILERTKPGNYNLVDPITGQSKRSVGAGIGSFLGTLLGFLTGNPFVSLAMGGFDRLKNFNQRLQDSDFGRSTSLMDFLDMRKYGGYDEREEARKKTMDESRLLSESLALSTDPRERRIMGLPAISVDKFTGNVAPLSVNNFIDDRSLVPDRGLDVAPGDSIPPVITTDDNVPLPLNFTLPIDQYVKSDVSPLFQSMVTPVGLSSKQKKLLDQRKSMLDALGAQGILDTITSENDPDNPATLEDVKKYYGLPV